MSIKRKVLIDRHTKQALGHALWWGIAIGAAAGMGFGIMLGLQIG